MRSNVSRPSEGDEAIGSAIASEMEERGNTQGLYLVFGVGQGPDIVAIRSFVKTASDTFLVDQTNHADDQQTPLDGQVDQLASVQLLRNGLSFELGAVGSAPSVSHVFDCDRPPVSQQHSVIQLMPGQHIASGFGTLPIMRSFMELARDLVQHFEAIEVVIWPPASSAIGRRFFDSSISDWLLNGTFPSLGLIAFQQGQDGQFRSEGLAHLIGQELCIAPELMDDPSASGGLSSRLVNQLILGGAVNEPQAIVAPNGRRLMLEPTSDGSQILVRPS